MQVILLERIHKLGQMGDVVSVKDGFARNFLLPQKKALRSNKANLAHFQVQRVHLEARNLELKKEAEAVHTKLEGKSFVSAQQRDEAQAEERLAESELTAATEEKQLARVEYKRAAALLEQRVLRSPFNGFVAERNMNPGELADQNASSKAILKLSELDPLKIEVTLPMDLFGQVNAGTPMQIKTEGGVVLNQVTVSSVDKKIDPKSGTFRAHITIPNPKNAIASGPRCEASLDAKARSP